MSSIRGVNVGGNLFNVTDSSNVAPIETTNFASRAYAKDRCFIMADGLLYRAIAEIEDGDPIVINGNCKKTTLDEIISVIETDSDLIAPTEDGATSSDDYAVGDEIVRSGILYKVIDDITEGDAFVVGNNIELAGSVSEQISSVKQTLANVKDSITSIDITGSTNNTGSAIASGTFFYLNGALVRAKTNIANGATLTLNTNYELVTAGGLNALNSDLSTKQDKLNTPWGNSIELSVYDGTRTSFTVPKSGLYCLSVNPSSSNNIVTNIYNSSSEGIPLYSGVAIGGGPTGTLVYLEANHTYTYRNISGAANYNKVRLFYQ